jgi:hypothetical protein
MPMPLAASAAPEIFRKPLLLTSIENVLLSQGLKNNIQW